MSHECSLCGYRFEDHEMTAAGCGSCASNSGDARGCGLVRCPACGYEWPPESGSTLARLIRKIFPVKESDRDQT